MAIYGELKGAQIESVAVLPINAPEGRLVRLSTDGFYYESDGTNWKKINSNEYSATKTYTQFDIVREANTYKTYSSLVDSNIGEALTDNTKWQYIGDLREASGELNVTLDAAETDIDWSLGSTFKQFMAADKVFTFSNMANKTIKIIITETNNKAITWPAYVQWGTVGAPTQTVLKTDVYEFTYSDGVVFGRRIIEEAAGSWPYGILGDLIVGAGVTTDLAAGQVYDYDNITIAATGKLRFTGNTTDFTILGAKTNFTLDGTIECKGSTAVGVASTTTPDGIAITSTITQKNGGAGGKGGDAENTYPGGVTSTGASGASQSAGVGGRGGGGGAVARSTFANGSGVTGGYAYSSSSTWARGGNAGYGGNKGTHGKNIYIHVTGDITGSGSIDVSGSNGSNGVNGGNGTYLASSTYASGAGGAGGSGGGAGGSAGKIVIRYHGTYATPLTYVVTGGSGGTKGTKGTGENSTVPSGVYAEDGVDGVNGTPGDAGSTDVANI